MGRHTVQYRSTSGIVQTRFKVINQSTCAAVSRPTGASVPDQLRTPKEGFSFSRRSAGLPLADSCPDLLSDPRRDPGRISCAFRARILSRAVGLALPVEGSGVSCLPKVPCWGERENLRCLRTGWRGDTPPLKGCCTVTFGYRTRTC